MLGNLGGQLPRQLSKYLGGMSFPADKDQVVRQAESKHADPGLLDALRQLPPGVYNNVGDIAERLSGSSALGDAIKGFGRKH